MKSLRFRYGFSQSHLPFLDDAVDYRSRPPCPALTELIMQGLLFNNAELPKTFDPFVEEEEAATMPKPANIRIPRRAETNKTQRYHSSGSDSESESDSDSETKKRNQRRMKPQPKTLKQGYNSPGRGGLPIQPVRQASPGQLPIVDMKINSSDEQSKSINLSGSGSESDCSARSARSDHSARSDRSARSTRSARSDRSNASSGVYLSQTESGSVSNSISEKNSTRVPHFNPSNPYNYRSPYN